MTKTKLIWLFVYSHWFLFPIVDKPILKAWPAPLWQFVFSHWLFLIGHCWQTLSLTGPFVTICIVWSIGCQQGGSLYGIALFLWCTWLHFIKHDSLCHTCCDTFCDISSKYICNTSILCDILYTMIWQWTPPLTTWTKALLPIGTNNIWIFNEYHNIWIFNECQNRLDEPLYIFM